MRRARRGDIDGVRTLIGSAGAATRADRKRFRQLVSTRREDCYVAEPAAGGALVGLVLVSYTRGLDGPTATIRRVATTSPAAVGPLLERARELADARHCRRLEIVVHASDASALGAALGEGGWDAGPQTFVRPVTS